KLVAGDTLTTSLFYGVDVTWGRVGRTDIGDDLAQALRQFSHQNPQASVPALLAVRKKIMQVKDDFWRTQKLDEINQVILHCAGIMAELYAHQPQAVRGETLPFTLNVIARSVSSPVVISSARWGGSDSSMNLRLSADTLYSI